MNSMRERIPASDWVLGGGLLLCFLVAAANACFSDRSPSFDEMGLFNPTYLFFQDERMTYPAHGHPDAMVVHPPMLYFLVGSLMHLGLSPFQAAGALLTLASAIVYWQLWKMRDDLVFSVSFGTAYVIGVCFINWLLTLRPDVHLAAFWLGGLVTLERCRREQWAPVHAFFGALLLTLAASIHYVGPGALVAVAVYAVALLRKQGKRSLKPLAAMTLGGFSVGIPYLLIWAIPHREAILAMTGAVQGEGGLAGLKVAAHHYLEAFSLLRQADLSRYDWITRAALTPLVVISTTAAPLAAVLLLARRSTRLLGLAALPHVLFIIFFVRGGLKKGFLLYYTPEFMIYVAGIVGALLALSWWVVRRLNWAPRLGVAAIGAGVAAIIAGVAATHPRFNYTPALDEWEFARYAGQEILGPNSSAGLTSAGPWYTCGAQTIYFLNGELIERPSLASVDVPGLLSNFDGLIVYGQNSDTTYNDRKFTLSSGVSSGLLSIRGFYFDDRRDWYSSRASYMVAALQAKETLLGFGQQAGQFFRFREDSTGEFVFVAWESAGHEMFASSWWKQPLFLAEFALPPRAENPTPLVLRSLVFARTDFEAIAPHLAAQGRLLKTTRLSRESLKRSEWKEKRRATADRIWFPKDLGSLLERSGRLSPAGVVIGSPTVVGLSGNVSEIPLKLFQRADAAVQFDAESGRLRTTPGQWSYALLTEPIVFTDPGEYWITLEYESLAGQLAFGALAGDRSQWLVQAATLARDPVTVNGNPRKGFYIRVAAGQPVCLIVTNNRVQDAVTTAVLKRVSISKIVGGSLPPIASRDFQSKFLTQNGARPLVSQPGPFGPAHKMVDVGPLDTAAVLKLAPPVTSLNLGLHIIEGSMRISLRTCRHPEIHHFRTLTAADNVRELLVQPEAKDDAITEIVLDNPSWNQTSTLLITRAVSFFRKPLDDAQRVP